MGDRGKKVGRTEGSKGGEVSVPGKWGVAEWIQYYLKVPEPNRQDRRKKKNPRQGGPITGEKKRGNPRREPQGKEKGIDRR